MQLKMKKKASLSQVREILTEEIFHNPTYKGIFYFVRDFFFFVCAFVALNQFNSWYVLPFFWFLAGLTISALFVVGHDCAHGALFKSEKLNYLIGQVAMLPSLHAYHQWAYGHNRVHHGHTIKLQADFVWHPVSPEEYSQFSFVKKLFHRLNWSFFGAGFYYLWEIWLKGMVMYSAPIQEAKRDKKIVLTFFIIVTTIVIYSYAMTESGFSFMSGLWGFFKIVFMPFLVWNYFIGFTVYVHHIEKDIPWKNREDWTPFYGQMVGTINYHVNPIYNFFVHNIYIHSPHHVHMKIPFYNLNLALQKIKEHFPEYVKERTSLFSDYWKNTKNCKLMNYQTGEWMNYKEAKNYLLGQGV